MTKQIYNYVKGAERSDPLIEKRPFVVVVQRIIVEEWEVIARTEEEAAVVVEGLLEADEEGAVSISEEAEVVEAYPSSEEDELEPEGVS